MSKFRILIIADEEWNDNVFGNNVLTNWFEGFDADFAEIYCSPGIPENRICKYYFQITDSMMLKSLFYRKKAGKFLYIDSLQREIKHIDSKPSKFYRFMKVIATEGIRALRDLLWLLGRYDKESMYSFVSSYKPDVVFCPRLLTPKLLRLEKIIHGMTTAPIVAFTGDDEASFNQYNYSPVYWIRRYLFNLYFEKNVPNIYSYYLMHSKEQAKFYYSKYGIPTKCFYKAGNFDSIHTNKTINNPIRIVYAGRLYCNRWKTLVEVGKVLRQINKQEVKIILDIYTTDTITKGLKKELDDGINIRLKGRVSSDQLSTIYTNSDIALHVESFDKKNRLATRLSFSTKIIDCMASSCAVIAICNEDQTGLVYLKDNDAGICISNYNEIHSTLKNIVKNPHIITEYSAKAADCGRRNHNRLIIQKQLMDIFNYVIKNK